MKEVFVEALLQLAERDPKLIVLTADLGYAMFEPFVERFPRQYLNVGVAEQNMMGVAAGLALDGRTVFTYSIANFPTLRCLEQVRNDVCYHGANVKVVAIGAGFSYGPLGFSHHATEDLAILRSLPEMTVLSPGDDWEAAECTQAAAQHVGPCYIRLDKGSIIGVPQSDEPFAIGRARRLREGRDATLVATGGILPVVIDAADRLAQNGLECRVLSMPTVKPLDIEALADAAQDTGGIFTVEEHTIDGGLGGAVAESLLEYGAAPRVFHRFGLRGGFATLVGSQAYLRKAYQLDAESIAQEVPARLAIRRPRASLAA